MLTSVGLVPQGEEPIPAAVEDAEGGLVGATHVTGTYVAGWTTKRGSDSETDARWGTYDAFLERHWEWSDPRLPQKMLLAESWDFFPVGSADISGAISLTQNVRLEGPDGAWTGTAYGLIEEAMTIGSWTYPQTVLMVLEGERAYEGLSAMLATTYDEPPVVNEVPGWAGYIFEGGMTPLPEAPEPPSAE